MKLRPYVYVVYFRANPVPVADNPEDDSPEPVVFIANQTAGSGFIASVSQLQDITYFEVVYFYW